MIRVLFTLAALGFLVGAVLSAAGGNVTIALGCAGMMALMFLFAVVADRSGEGLPDPPAQSSP